MSCRQLGVDRGIGAEEGEAGVSLTQHTHAHQIAEGLRKHNSAAVLGDDEGIGREERSSAEKCEDAAVFVAGGKGRVKENNVERGA